MTIRKLCTVRVVCPGLCVTVGERISRVQASAFYVGFSRRFCLTRTS